MGLSSCRCSGPTLVSSARSLTLSASPFRISGGQSTTLTARYWETDKYDDGSVVVTPLPNETISITNDDPGCGSISVTSIVTDASGSATLTYTGLTSSGATRCPGGVTAHVGGLTSGQVAGCVVIVRNAGH
jgi:hypothetical protein